MPASPGAAMHTFDDVSRMMRSLKLKHGLETLSTLLSQAGEQELSHLQAALFGGVPHFQNVVWFKMIHRQLGFLVHYSSLVNMYAYPTSKRE